MLEGFVYENHLGQRFDGLEHGVYLNCGNLRDFLWSYDTINGRISRLYYEITERAIPLVIIGDTEAEAVAAQNRLAEIAEADICARIPGKVFVGDYYTNGYLTASSKSAYMASKRYCCNELTLTSDDPSWYREKTYSFVKGQSNMIGQGDGKDYLYDYPYDYAISQNGQKIVCDSVSGGSFRLRIYGEATNPVIIINGHAYSVKGTVGAGDILLIDGTSKTITLTTAIGGKINWFDKRSRDSYIFEQIQSGQNTVSWDGSFGFDLTVIEKRSEPKWT